MTTQNHRWIISPGWHRLISLGLAIALSLGLLLRLPSSSAQSNRAAATATGRGGAVASVDARATQIGIDVLKAGGNAIDAAVATAAALGVVEPFSAGIGGGGFMMIYLKDQNRVVTLDGREEAPASATPTMFDDPDHPGQALPFMPNRISNGAAVGVPGTLLTWSEALARYGTISLANALKPAIALATDGYEVDATYAQQLSDNQSRFAAFPATQALLFPNGQLPAVGSRIRNPDLAKTYRLIAERGINHFYRGEIGEAIVRTVQKPPTVEHPPFRVIAGGMTMTDLDHYNVRIRTPIKTTYRGYTVYGMGLPSSGGITGSEVFQIVKGFNLKTLPRAQALHTILEAERLAFADRNAYLGDPEYVDVPLAGLLSEAFAQVRRRSLGDRAPTSEPTFVATAANPLAYQSDPSPSLTVFRPPAAVTPHEGQSTTHLTVVDRLGNVVSYTLTIEATGGSGIVVPGYGFILNNELTDFDPVIPHPNTPEPGKRPRSSIAPTIAFAPDGQIIAFGSPGGSTIITTVLGIAFNVMDFGMTLDQAIAAPRLSQRNGGSTQIDSGFEQSDLGRSLAALGHTLQPTKEIGAATGIVLQPDGRILAAAEPVRRGGGSAMVVSLTP
jgi:gamma-glutamyltranspeptidase/glutathione hydrolase